MTIKKFIEYISIDISGKKLDSINSLTLNVCEKSGNHLLHKDLLKHYQSLRQSTSSTKTRSEVRGGGKKPWQQKGTGRARAGSNRSPLWKGGGVIFGPKPKNRILKLNKKERRLALQTLIYNKKSKTLIIADLENSFIEIKTKYFLKTCQNCSINLKKKVLIVVAKKTVPLKLSTQNLNNVEIILASNLNTLSLLNAEQIIVTTLALKNIEEIYCG